MECMEGGRKRISTRQMISPDRKCDDADNSPYSCCRKVFPAPSRRERNWYVQSARPMTPGRLQAHWPVRRKPPRYGSRNAGTMRLEMGELPPTFVIVYADFAFETS